MQAQNRLSVIKLGGSLFDLPDLGLRMQRLQEAACPGPVWIVPGGGRLADVVREWDAIHRLPSPVSHRLAIRGMSVSATLLSALLPGAVIAESLTAARALSEGSKWVVLDVWSCPEIAALPASWDVTSDAIALVIAQAAHAAQLVFAKSVDLPEPPPRLREISGRGLLDRYCAGWTGTGLQLGWVNLRDDPGRVVAIPGAAASS